MTAKYVQERVGDFIHTYTGGKFYVLDPKPEDVVIDDIAHALSQLCRYTGHTKYKFYSVGEHAIVCCAVAKHLGFSPRIQFLALNHDDSEAYCADVNRPLKQNLNDYKDAEDKIMDAIWEALNIKPTQEEYEIIKKIDNTLLVSEMKHLMFDKDFRPEIDYFEDIEIDLLEIYDMSDIEEAFLDIFHDLVGEMND